MIGSICDDFLFYLEDQENEELITIEKLGSGITWKKKFIPAMRTTFEQTKRYIQDKGY